MPIAPRDSVGVLIPTLNAAEVLPKLLSLVRGSQVVSDILVVDSASSDPTVGIALANQVEVLRIERSDFNHGTTRELGRLHLGTDIVVMLSQDALPSDRSSIGRLIEPILAKRASLTYGRQVPCPAADYLERFLRMHNYPSVSFENRVSTKEPRAAGTSFFSNAFSAYRSEHLDVVGGFPYVISNEDTIVAGLMLEAGFTLAYVAEATAVHSHPIRLGTEFRRNFDAAAARASSPSTASNGALGRIAVSFSTKLLARTAKGRPVQLPRAAAYLAVRGSATILGAHAGHLPLAVSKRLSGNPSYWRAASGNYIDSTLPLDRAED